MKSRQDLRGRVWKSNMELYYKNLLVVNTFGNASGIDREEGFIAIKPSGIPYSELTADINVLVDLENHAIDSEYNPSSDTKAHLVLYNNFPSIRGVAHTHSPYATAWAQSKRSVPCLGTTHANYCRGEIPCTAKHSNEQIKGDYETETGYQIVNLLNDHLKSIVNMILVAEHGPFTWGESPEDAVSRTVLLEEICKITFYTEIINPYIKSINLTLIDKHFLRKHGKDSYYGQK